MLCVNANCVVRVSVGYVDWVSLILQLSPLFPHTVKWSLVRIQPLFTPFSRICRTAYAPKWGNWSALRFAIFHKSGIGQASQHVGSCSNRLPFTALILHITSTCEGNVCIFRARIVRICCTLHILRSDSIRYMCRPQTKGK